MEKHIINYIMLISFSIHLEINCTQRNYYLIFLMINKCLMINNLYLLDMLADSTEVSDFPMNHLLCL